MPKRKDDDLLGALLLFLIGGPIFVVVSIINNWNSIMEWMADNLGLVIFVGVCIVLLFYFWRKAIKRNRIMRYQDYLKAEEEYQRQKQKEEEKARLRQKIFALAGIEEIDRMTGAQFEEKMAEHFRVLGWQVEKTPTSQDYGADLLLTTPDGRKIAAQLKRYSGPVGISAVQEVLGAIQHYKADSGMIITNSHLTRNASALAFSSGIEVWQREELIQHLQDAVLELDQSNSALTVKDVDAYFEIIKELHPKTEYEVPDKDKIQEFSSREQAIQDILNSDMITLHDVDASFLEQAGLSFAEMLSVRKSREALAHRIMDNKDVELLSSAQRKITAFLDDHQELRAKLEEQVKDKFWSPPATGKTLLNVTEEEMRLAGFSTVEMNLVKQLREYIANRDVTKKNLILKKYKPSLEIAQSRLDGYFSQTNSPSKLERMEGKS